MINNRPLPANTNRYGVFTCLKIGFDVAIPMRAKRCQVVQCLPHTHPWVKSHKVRHVRQSPLDLHFLPDRVQPQHRELPGARPQQVQEAFHHGSFAGAVPAKQAVTLASRHREVEIMHRLGPPIGVGQVADDNGWGGIAHKSLGVAFIAGATFILQNIQTVTNQIQELGSGHLQVMCLDDDRIDLLGQQLAPDVLLQR